MQYFKDRGITALLTYEISTMFGREVLMTGRGVSHIADNVLLIRYRAEGARIRRALTVLKARGSGHSNEVREYLISEAEGVRVGEPLVGGLSLD